MATALRPLTLGELLDRTFLLYRRHFLVFVGIAALPNLLVLATQLVNIALGADGQLSGAVVATALIAGLIAIAVSAMVQAATLVAVSRLHLERPVSIGNALASIKDRVLPILGFILLTALVLVSAVMVVAIPAVLLGSLTAMAIAGIAAIPLAIGVIIVALRLALVIPVLVLERRSIAQSIARSWRLTSGSALRVFVIYALFTILTMVITGIAQVPMFIAAFTAAQSGAQGLPTWAAVLSQVGNFVSQSLVTPLLTIAIALLYYDERVRKEAFDLEHMMSQLDAAAVGRPVTA